MVVTMAILDDSEGPDERTNRYIGSATCPEANDSAPFRPPSWLPDLLEYGSQALQHLAHCIMMNKEVHGGDNSGALPATGQKESNHVAA